MDLLKIGAQLLMSKIGGGALNEGGVMSALSKLLPTNGGELDLGSLVSKFSGGGLMSMASSWLGDGDNEAVGSSQILDIFGEDKVSEFASELNIDKGAAAEGLSGMIPDLISKQSEGGSLLGGLGALGKMFS